MLNKPFLEIRNSDLTLSATQVDPLWEGVTENEERGSGNQKAQDKDLVRIQIQRQIASATKSRERDPPPPPFISKALEPQGVRNLPQLTPSEPNVCAYLAKGIPSRPYSHLLESPGPTPVPNTEPSCASYGAFSFSCFQKGSQRGLCSEREARKGGGRN